jgi:hypothetical protein
MRREGGGLCCRWRIAGEEKCKQTTQMFSQQQDVCQKAQDVYHSRQSSSVGHVTPSCSSVGTHGNRSSQIRNAHTRTHTHAHTPLHYYTTLHYTTTLLHYTTLHYTTLHYTTLHYTTLHYTTLHYTTQSATDARRK